MRQAMMFSKRGTSTAEAQALINASIGGDQMDFIETCRPFSSSNASDTANQAFFHRVRVAKAITVSQMTVLMGVASGNIDLAIYQSDGTTLTRLASTGSTAAVGTNAAQTINLTAPVTLQPGVDYYLAYSKDNATVAIARTLTNQNGIGAFKNRDVRVAATYPLPASVTLASLSGTGAIWWIAAS